MQGGRMNIVRILLKNTITSSPNASIGDPLLCGFPTQPSGMTVFLMRLPDALMRRWLLVVAALLLLAGCSEAPVWQAPAQRWQDLTIHVETRPEVIVPGMNEFLLIANHQQRGFINDLLVEVRTPHSHWQQAIPDGALGVFRRALPVDAEDIRHGRLYVRLTRNGKHGELSFPLSKAAE